MRAARSFKLSKDSLQHKCTSPIAWLHAPLLTTFRLPMVLRDGWRVDLRLVSRGAVHLPSGYTDGVELWEAPVVASAHRHGVTDDDIRHALRNFIAVAADPRDDDVTLFLGSDRAVNLIEIGVLGTDEGPLIIHAMAARAGRFRASRE